MERVRAGRQPGTSGRINEAECFHYPLRSVGHCREPLAVGIRPGMRIPNWRIPYWQVYRTRSAQV